MKDLFLRLRLALLFKPPMEWIILYHCGPTVLQWSKNGHKRLNLSKDVRYPSIMSQKWSVLAVPLENVMDITLQFHRMRSRSFLNRIRKSKSVKYSMKCFYFSGLCLRFCRNAESTLFHLKIIVKRRLSYGNGDVTMFFYWRWLLNFKKNVFCVYKHA